MNFIRESPCQIGKYLPKFIQRDKQMNDAINIESAEHDRQRILLMDILNQFFIESATWALDDWEAVLDIKHAENDTFQQRRKRILLKLQSHQTSTKEFIEKLAARYTSGNVILKEQNPKNSFQLQFDKLPYDFQGLREAIETYKPAHLKWLLVHLIKANCSIFAGGCVTQHKRTNIDMAKYTGGDKIQKPLYFAGFVRVFKRYNLKTID